MTISLRDGLQDHSVLDVEPSGSASLQPFSAVSSLALETAFYSLSLAHVTVGGETAKIVPANASIISGAGDDIYAATTATSGVIAPGGSVASAIDFDNDHDWFAITLQAGLIYDFSMNGTGGAPLEDPYLEIFNSAGVVLGHDDDGGPGRNAHLAFFTTEAGTYYISAESWSDDQSSLTYQGGYTLSVGLGVAPTTDTIGDNQATAQVLTLGVSQTSRIDRPDDNDWFAVDLVAGQGYDFSLTGDSAFDVEMQIYDGNGVLIAGNDDFGGTIDAHIDFEAATTGRFYIVARGLDNAAYGQYSLSAAVGDRPLLTQSIDWGTQVAAPTGVVKVYFATAGQTFDGETSLGWNAYEIQQVMAVLSTYSHYINLTFVQTTNQAEAQFKLVVNNDLDAGILAYMNPPGTDNAGVGVFARDGSGWDEGGSGGLEPGGLGYATLVHELGHGLGLAHPFDGGGTATVMTGVFDSDDYVGYGWQNQGVYTAMSYNDGWPGGPVPDTVGRTSGYQSTPMAIDVALLQSKYGVNPNWNGGDNTYVLSPTTSGAGYYSIWDTGGSDTITVSDVNSAVATVIDLRPASMFYTGPASGGAISYMAGVASGLSIDAGVTIENAIGGAGDDSLTGNGAANTLTGNGGNDNLSGGAGLDTLNAGIGNDLLDGGAGADVMGGGIGFDTYYVDNLSDVLNELDAGNTVYSSVAWSLGSLFSDLYLQGGANLDGTGNDGANHLYGNDGDNTLSGGLGDDSLTGGAGNDRLLGGDGSDNDSLFGGDGGDYLDAGMGTGSVLQGDAGNDTYVIRNANDIISELDASSIDTVLAFVSYTLAGGTENLTLQGASALDGAGNNGDNIITGNSAANTLTGKGGNDRLDGGAGDDQLIGGTGDDTYVLDSAGDVATEAAGEGIDTVRSGASFTLAANFETLILTGAAAIDGTGNADANALSGNAGDNRLDGGAGADSLAGLAGNDSYYVDNAADLVTEASGGGTDTVFSSLSWVLATGQFVENLVLTSTAANATGNNLNNSLTGNASNNVLDGKAGADVMTGAAGNDTYVVDSAADVVLEAAGEGTDIIASSVRYTLGDNIERLTLTGVANIAGTGNALNNVITGNAGNNRIDGGLGADTMSGGAGDDNYVIDGAGDRVFENANEGNDSVSASFSYNLGNQYVENLTLTGTADIDAMGNGLANTLIGNSGNNVMNGGTGTDNMYGGAGNDTYYVDNVTDRTYETTTSLTDAGGNDIVYASVRVVLDQYVEALVITGTAGLAGTGNALNNTITGNSGNNVLSGKDGDDVLDGGLGADVMAGGVGNDTFYLDNVLDRVAEANGQGNDTVYSSVSFSLGNQFVETLTLTGTGNIKANGNAVANWLSGNDSDNILDGGGGADTLQGRSGADVFLFGLQSGLDIIADFSAIENDSINVHAYSQGTANGGGIVIAQVGSDTVVTLGVGNVITVQNTLAGDLDGHIVW